MIQAKNYETVFKLIA